MTGAAEECARRGAGDKQRAGEQDENTEDLGHFSSRDGIRDSFELYTTAPEVSR